MSAKAASADSHTKPPTNTILPATSTTTATVAVAIVNTSTPIRSVTLTNTPTPTELAPSFTPTLFVRPTRRPSPTLIPTLSYTFTPAGPLFDASSQDAISKVFGNAAKTLGGFPVDLDPSHIGGYLGGIDLPVQDGVPYGIVINFAGSAEAVYQVFQFYLAQQTNSKAIDLGDQAAVAYESMDYVAILRYRNVFVHIQRTICALNPNKTPFRMII